MHLDFQRTLSRRGSSVGKSAGFITLRSGVQFPPPLLTHPISGWVFYFYSMFTVYILYAQRFNKIYIGYSSDLTERLNAHNSLATKGWTIRFRPWVLVYTEEFSAKSEALKREKFLKSGIGRELIHHKILPDFLNSI